MSTVELPGGGQIVVTGAATAGQSVYVKDGRIDGTAPDVVAVVIVMV
jgi:hypothetical protein